MAMVRCAARCLLLLAVGCGDTLVPGEYGGSSKLLLRGKIDDARPALELPTDVVRAAVFWHPRGRVSLAPITETVEQPSNGRFIRYPGGFNWNLFEEPGPEHLATTASGARYGFGLPLAYLDASRDRRWQPQERLVADSPTSAILFALEPLSAAESPTGRAVAPGYHLISRTRFCAPEVVPVPDGECGVPIGRPCEVDAACGGGVCLVTEPLPWPGGYCAIPEPPPNGCRQGGTVLFRDAMRPDRAWWVKSCEAQSDCDRPFPFHCELTVGACVPTAHVLMEGSHEVKPRALCAEELPPKP
jgi:hypothetical protein